MPELIRPPKTSRLPDIVSVEQAQALFAATRTLSYRVFFFTVYSLALRLSEGLALSVADIDAERERVHVRDSKGNRDRFVPLPAATLVVLRRFWQEHRNPELLFPNRHGGLLAAARARTPLDRGGVQRALRRSSPNQWVEAGKPSIVNWPSRKLETILATHYPTHIPTAVDDAIRAKFPVRLAREAMRPAEPKLVL